MTLARKAGYVVPDAAYNKALAYLRNQVAATDNADYESKAILLHVLAVAGQGDFALANRLYRDRNALSSAALAHLALGFAAMDRKATGEEILGLLEKRNLDDTAMRRDAAHRRAALEPFAGRAAGALRLGRPRGLATDGQVVAQGQGTGRLAHGPPHRQPLGPGKGDRPRGPGLVPLVRRQPLHRRALQADRLRQRRASQGAGYRPGRRQPDRSTCRKGSCSSRARRASSGSTSRSPAAVATPISASSAVSCPPTSSRARPPVGGSNATTSRPRWNSTAARSPAVSACWKAAATSSSAIRWISFPSAAAAWSTSSSGGTWPWNTPEERLEYLVVTEPIPSGTTVIEKSVTGPFEHFEIGAGRNHVLYRQPHGPGHDPLRALRLRAGHVSRRPHDRPQRPPARAASGDRAEDADRAAARGEVGRPVPPHAAGALRVGQTAGGQEGLRRGDAAPDRAGREVEPAAGGLQRRRADAPGHPPGDRPAGQDRPLLRDHQGEVAQRGDPLRQDREGGRGLPRDGRVRAELPGLPRHGREQLRPRERSGRLPAIAGRAAAKRRGDERPAAELSAGRLRRRGHLRPGPAGLGQGPRGGQRREAAAAEGQPRRSAPPRVDDAGRLSHGLARRSRRRSGRLRLGQHALGPEGLSRVGRGLRPLCQALCPERPGRQLLVHHRLLRIRHGPAQGGPGNVPEGGRCETPRQGHRPRGGKPEQVAGDLHPRPGLSRAGRGGRRHPRVSPRGRPFRRRQGGDRLLPPQVDRTARGDHGQAGRARPKWN